MERRRVGDGNGKSTGHARDRCRIDPHLNAYHLERHRRRRLVVGVPGAVVAAGWCVGATADADGDAPQLASKNTLISTTKLTIIFFMTNVSFFFREVCIFYKFYVVEHLS